MMQTSVFSPRPFILSLGDLVVSTTSRICILKSQHSAAVNICASPENETNHFPNRICAWWNHFINGFVTLWEQ